MDQCKCQDAVALGLLAALLYIARFHSRFFNQSGDRVVATAAFRRRCSSCRLSFLPIYLSVVTVVKDENLYLPEWIEYHLLVGVERFHLVLNRDEQNASEVLGPYISSGIVNLSRWDGRGQQRSIYNNYIPKLKDEYCWIAIMDVDEFLVPLEGHSVPEIIRRFERFPGVVMNCVTFGTNGKLKRENGLVIERFPHHTAFNLSWNQHTKSIVNPRMTTHYDIHEHNYVGGRKAVDAKGREMKVSGTKRPPMHEVLRVNHYRAKSAEEFRLKLLRGRADLGHGRQLRPVPHILRDEISILDDVVANDSAVEWAIPLVKENLARTHTSMDRVHFMIALGRQCD